MPAPRSAWHLAWVCNRLALQGFGGVLAVAQHEFVEREQWLSPDEFLALLATAQLMPGPNVVNLCLMVGDRHFGARGMVAALAGLITIPVLLLVTVASAVLGHAQHAPVAGALRGMGLAAAALLLGTCWRLAQPLRRSPLGLPRAVGLGALALILVGVLRWPLAPTLLGLVVVGSSLAWHTRQRQ